MSTTTATESLFDRDAEVALLREALADARDGRGRLVTVEGEPGIGKTALLATVAREATAAGCTVRRSSTRCCVAGASARATAT